MTVNDLEEAYKIANFIEEKYHCHVKSFEFWTETSEDDD